MYGKQFRYHGIKGETGVQGIQGATGVNNIIVDAKTSDYTVLSSELLGNKVFTNEGATGNVIFSLPTAVAGYRVKFIVREIYSLVVKTFSGDLIYTSDVDSVQYVTSKTKGAIINVNCINDGEWICETTRTWADAEIPIWLDAPTSKDYSEEKQFIDMHINASGIGARIIVTTTSPATYKLQKTTDGGITWTDATTTIPYSTGTATTFPDNLGGDYYYKGRIFVDENGKCAMVLHRYIQQTAANGVFAYYSNDRDTWTMFTGADAQGSLTASATGYAPGAIYIRENKAVILTNHRESGASYIFISNNTGSGYATWSSQISLTKYFQYDKPCAVFIRYDGAQTGDAKYQIVTLGGDDSNDQIAYNSHNGAGSPLANGYAMPTTTIYSGSYSIDLAGNKNVIHVIAHNGTTIKQVESNDYTSGGAISWSSEHSIGDGNAVDIYNGYTSGDKKHLIWNDRNRGIIVGNFAYHVLQTNANTGGKPAAMLIYSTNVSGAVWSYANVGTTGDVAVQEASLVYLSGKNKLVLVFKTVDAVANNLTKGNIWARVANINPSTGALTWGAITQIDGGKSASTFAGFCQAVAAYDLAVAVTWEEATGVLKGQFLKSILD